MIDIGLAVVILALVWVVVWQRSLIVSSRESIDWQADRIYELEMRPLKVVEPPMLTTGYLSVAPAIPGPSGANYDGPGIKKAASKKSVPRKSSKKPKDLKPNGQLVDQGLRKKHARRAPRQRTGVE